MNFYKKIFVLIVGLFLIQTAFCISISKKPLQISIKCSELIKSFREPKSLFAWALGTCSVFAITVASVSVVSYYAQQNGFYRLAHPIFLQSLPAFTAFIYAIGTDDELFNG